MPHRRDPAVRALGTGPADPLVGRGTALNDLRTLLCSEARIVTIIGPAGVGKSRVAWELACSLTHDGAFEGAAIAEFDGIDNVQAGEDTLLRTLGVRSRSKAAVGPALDGAGQCLVVVDGFDALVAAADSTIGAWSRQAPAVRFLITSRRPLGLGAEHVYELGTLELPVGDAPTGEAAELFLRLIGKVRAGYTPSAAEAPFITDLVRELDGLPLALELAAPRLAVMGPRVLLHRLRTSRSVLRVSSDVRPHRSFDSAIEGSWSSLTDVERDVLAQLTVFASGATIEAAEHVVSTLDGSPVVDVLQSLRDRSMLSPATTPDGGVRMRVLRGIANYVKRHGDPKARQEAMQRHAAYYAAESTKRETQARTSSGTEARAWFAAEHDELISVVRRVARSGQVTARAAEPALRVLIAVERGRGLEAPGHELSSLLETALDSTRDSGADPLLFGRALVLRGAVRRMDGRVPGATRDLMQAIHVGRTLGSASIEGTALVELGRLLLDQDELEHARSHFRQGMEALDAARARLEESDAWMALAELEARAGRLAEAIALLERSVALFARMQAPEDEGRARCELARLHIHVSDWPRAEEQVRSARQLALGQRSLLPLEIDLIEVIIRHDSGANDCANTYAVVESAAQRRGAAGIEAEALVFQALAQVQNRAFGQAHALFQASFDTGALHRDPRLWAAVSAAIDARVTPRTQSIPPDATTRASTHTGKATALFRNVATSPSTWTEARNELLALNHQHVVIRLAIRAIDQTTRHVTTALPNDALVVGGGGRWFRMPGGEPISLERRRPLALILDRLAEAREQKSGAALPWEELQGAGWPGERIIASAGAHRVRVAVSTMRKLGLRDALETAPEGYKLSATLPVVRVSEGIEVAAG